MIFWQNVEESCTFQKIYGVWKVKFQTKWPGRLEKYKFSRKPLITELVVLPLYTELFQIIITFNWIHATTEYRSILCNIVDSDGNLIRKWCRPWSPHKVMQVIKDIQIKLLDIIRKLAHKMWLAVFICKRTWWCVVCTKFDIYVLIIKHGLTIANSRIEYM